MESLVVGSRTYALDDQGFLCDSSAWDEAFARGLAPRVGIHQALSDRHWRVIRFIRSEFDRDAACPIVFRVCRANNLRLSDLKELFPTGYLRGACRLAGLTYADRPRDFYGERADARQSPLPRRDVLEKAYRVNALGFLLDAGEWDESFALHKAEELGIRGGLTDRHWEIIRFLREAHARTGQVPTVFEACQACSVEVDEFERLFPTGYHRGAVKIAGLRAAL